MRTLTKSLMAIVVALGGITASVPDADAQRVVRRGPGYYYGGYYRRPFPSYYYAAPLLAAPAIYYYSTGGRRYTCAQLEYKCDRGEGWACRVLERDPNC